MLLILTGADSTTLLKLSGMRKELKSDAAVGDGIGVPDKIQEDQQRGIDQGLPRAPAQVRSYPFLGTSSLVKRNRMAHPCQVPPIVTLGVESGPRMKVLPLRARIAWSRSEGNRGCIGSKLRCNHWHGLLGIV